MKVELKLKKIHPKKAFRLGRHVVTNLFQEFDLNDAEIKELGSKGCQHWLMEKEAKKKVAKKVEKKAKKEDK